MKRVILVSTTVFLILSLAGAASAADVKIGYVNGQLLITESQAGQDALAELKALKDQKEAEAMKMDQQIKMLGEQLSAKSAAMGQRAREDLEAQQQQQIRELQRYMKDSQEELKRKQIALLKPIDNELEQIIITYGKENSFDMIMDVGQPGILYASEKIDLTKEIMDIFDKSHQEKKAKEAE